MCLRCVAILLILNSHMDQFYPCPAIGTGGAIGNAIFFALSSFGLVLSLQRTPIPFSQWWVKRIFRIYPAVWVALVVYWFPLELLTCPDMPTGIFALLGHFFYPPFWFLQALLAFYPIAYVLAKSGRGQAPIIVLAVTLILYCMFYLTVVDTSRWSVEEFPFKMFSCLLYFILGAWLAQRNPEIRYKGPVDGVILVGLLLAIYGHKYLMSRGWLDSLQALEQLLLLPLVFYALKVSRSDFVTKRLMAPGPVASVITIISTLTLEIYMVHTTIKRPLMTFDLPFPAGALVFVGLTLVLAAVTHWMGGKLRSCIDTLG